MQAPGGPPSQRPHNAAVRLVLLVLPHVKAPPPVRRPLARSGRPGVQLRAEGRPARPAPPAGDRAGVLRTGVLPSSRCPGRSVGGRGRGRAHPQCRPPPSMKGAERHAGGETSSRALLNRPQENSLQGLGLGSSSGLLLRLRAQLLPARGRCRSRRRRRGSSPRHSLLPRHPLEGRVSPRRLHPVSSL